MTSDHLRQLSRICYNICATDCVFFYNIRSVQKGLRCKTVIFTSSAGQGGGGEGVVISFPRGIEQTEIFTLS